MIRGFAVLLLFQLAGEVMTRLAGLPVPGPVIGMVLLVLALELGLPSGDGLRAASGGVLAHLSLLFVPAGVGIVQHLPRISQEWPALSIAIVVSTTATIAVAGLTASHLSQPAAGPSEGT
jgi:holin-like protein